MYASMIAISLDILFARTEGDTCTRNSFRCGLKTVMDHLDFFSLSGWRKNRHRRGVEGGMKHSLL